MSMNACHCWGVITESMEKANAVFAEVEASYPAAVSCRFENKFGRAIVFMDGMTIRWFKPSFSARGYRFHRLWVDRNLSDNSDLMLRLSYSAPYLEKEIVYI